MYQEDSLLWGGEPGLAYLVTSDVLRQKDHCECEQRGRILCHVFPSPSEMLDSHIGLSTLKHLDPENPKLWLGEPNAEVQMI